MAKSGNSWFKIKREKLRKQVAAAPRPVPVGLPHAERVAILASAPIKQGRGVTLIARNAVATKEGRFALIRETWGKGRPRLDKRTFGDGTRRGALITPDSYVSESRLIRAGQ